LTHRDRFLLAHDRLHGTSLENEKPVLRSRGQARMPDEGFFHRVGGD
jgi:hypothetical protein